MKFTERLNISLFTISFGKLEFKPGLLPTLVTLALLYLLLSLGQWQLSRADFKKNLEQLVKERSQLDPIPFTEISGNPSEQSYLPVKTRGRFDTRHQIFLDNRVVNHQPGYDVYTPLQLDDGSALLVNRGWIKQGRTRSDLPNIDISEQMILVQGILSEPPSAGLVLSEDANRFQQWPAMAQFINVREIEKALGHALYPLVLNLDADSKFAFHREPVRFNMSSDKHLGYAFQWFGLALTLLIIFFVVNTKRRNKPNDR